MPTLDWMEDEVRKALPDARVEVTDLTGTADHFHVLIVDASLDGMRPLQRQKLVLDHFKEHIPHHVHALDLKLLTPAEAVAHGEDTGPGTMLHDHS